jgi:hypothetical protein
MYSIRVDTMTNDEPNNPDQDVDQDQREEKRQDVAPEELTNNLNGISGLGVVCRISFDRKLRMSDMKEILDIVMHEVDQRAFQA